APRSAPTRRSSDLRAPQADARPPPSARLNRSRPARAAKSARMRQCGHSQHVPDTRMKPYLLALLGAFSLSACAQTDSPPAAAADPAPAPQQAAADSGPKVAPGSADERARDAIRKLNKQIRIDHIGAAPIAGFREAIVGGQ